MLENNQTGNDFFLYLNKAYKKPQTIHKKNFNDFISYGKTFQSTGKTWCERSVYDMVIIMKYTL